jgi:uncharacterized protein YjiS (DUF1127 family)
MKRGENTMTTHMPVRSEPLARGRLASEDWARIDPVVYMTEARRHQARAVAEALGASWRGCRRALSGFGKWAQRHVVQPLVRRSERRRAMAQLTALDGRLLADIGLRRSDIELAVDGLLADPRVTRRMPASAAVLTEQWFQSQRGAGSAATTSSNRAAGAGQAERTVDLAA